MIKTVSFETAKRLKEAGFPQPEFRWSKKGDAQIVCVMENGCLAFQIEDTRGRRFWPIDADGRYSWPINNMSAEMCQPDRLIYAPTAADICGIDAEEEAEKWIKINRMPKGETKQPPDNAVCGGCGKVEQWWNLIDNWAMVNGVKYCRSCQKRLKIGHYAPGKNDKNG